MRHPVTRRTALGTIAALAGSAALPAGAETPLAVVATTGMIADAARVVGGPAAEVTALMGPGIDPHAYRQTRSDIARLTRADLVLWNGLFLEAQMEGFLLDLARKRPVVAVAETGVPAELLIGHDDYEARKDPHVWMDPALWVFVVRAVEAALAEARPDTALGFAGRSAAHVDELQTLSEYADDVLATVPEESRVLLSAHDAFNYFGRAHGYEVLGIQGISTESEAGLRRIEELVALLVQRRIGAVFVESSVSERNVRAVIEGAAAQGHEVRIGGELFSDAMGAPGSYEATYLGMIDHNVTTIARALGGRAPERGRLGKLAAGS
ncbi:MAG: zinc ABC transporter substrate-binding protein [Pseudomonadota bacterium]